MAPPPATQGLPPPLGASLCPKHISLHICIISKLCIVTFRRYLGVIKW